MQRQLIVPEPLWLETWSGLASRGGGQREAACIWAGHRDDQSETVEQIVFLDDFDETVAHGLYHRTPRSVTAELFRLLRERELVIVGDVHSHPDEWVGLSPVDSAHPIEYRVGLRALVLPHYSIGEPSTETVGVHEYLGDKRWHQLSISEVRRVLRIPPGARR